MNCFINTDVCTHVHNSSHLSNIHFEEDTKKRKKSQWQWKEFLPVWRYQHAGHAVKAWGPYTAHKFSQLCLMTVPKHESKLCFWSWLDLFPWLWKYVRVSPAVFPDDVSLEFNSREACIIIDLTSRKLRVLKNISKIIFSLSWLE